MAARDISMARGDKLALNVELKRKVEGEVDTGNTRLELEELVSMRLGSIDR